MPPQRAQPSSSGPRLLLPSLAGQKGTAVLCCPCDSCLVHSTDLKGSEAGKRASVVMASSGQVPRVPGRGGSDRQGGEGTGGDEMQNREKRAARTPQPQRKCPHGDTRVNAWTAWAAASARTGGESGLGARTAGAPPSASTADRGESASRVDLFCFYSRSLSFYSRSLYFSSDTRLLLPAPPVSSSSSSSSSLPLSLLCSLLSHFLYFWSAFCGSLAKQA